VQTENASDAIRHYESALAIDATHTRSLIGLAAIQHQLFAAAAAVPTPPPTHAVPPHNNPSNPSASYPSNNNSHALPPKVAAGANLELAYGYLTAALQIDGTSHHAWFVFALPLLCFVHCLSSAVVWVVCYAGMRWVWCCRRKASTIWPVSTCSQHSNWSGPLRLCASPLSREPSNTLFKFIALRPKLLHRQPLCTHLLDHMHF
jgi:hypothetical protein